MLFLLDQALIFLSFLSYHFSPLPPTLFFIVLLLKKFSVYFPNSLFVFS